MTLNSDIVKILFELGYIASGMGRYREADIIFDALHHVRPETSDHLAGRAFNKMNEGDPQKAIQILREEVLTKDPENEHAQCILGLALKISGYSYESDQITSKIAQSSKDPAILGLADIISTYAA